MYMLFDMNIYKQCWTYKLNAYDNIALIFEYPCTIKILEFKNRVFENYSTFPKIP